MFREQFAQRPGLWRTGPLVSARGEEHFNVAKTHAGEPALWVRLHRLQSRAADALRWRTVDMVDAIVHCPYCVRTEPAWSEDHESKRW